MEEDIVWGSAVNLSKKNKKKGADDGDEEEYKASAMEADVDDEADTVELDAEEREQIASHQASVVQTKRRRGGKPACWWAERCYRKDRAHFRKFVTA